MHEKARLANCGGDGRAISQTVFLMIKPFFFLFLKINFVFTIKKFVHAGDIIEPSIEMDFYMRFSVTRS